MTAAYGLSWLYVLADTAVKTSDDFQLKKDKVHAGLTAAYTFSFHCIASMALPAFTVHSIVNYSKKAIDGLNLLNTAPRVRGWAPTVLALTSIPFIIHPIDEVSEYILERTLHPLLFGSDAQSHSQNNDHNTTTTTTTTTTSSSSKDKAGGSSSTENKH